MNFNWGQQPPAAGMPSENFSVRWTGWLLPPASGRYVFHVTVDDGIRIWVNDKLILNEWRGQPVSNYTAAVELKANEPYRLRIDYCQYSMETRAVVTWDRPDTAPPPASWRNLWGMTADAPLPQPIPTQFLFARNPRPTPPLVVPLRQISVTAKAPLQPQRKPRLPRPPRTRTARPAAVVRAAPTPAPAAATLPASPPSAALLVADSASTRQLARLSVGESVTLPELYFNQGKAQLLPPARTALDGLAAALRSRPELNFEVQGHTDNVGNAELNRQLSQQRAEAVCLYLTAHGVATGPAPQGLRRHPARGRQHRPSPTAAEPPRGAAPAVAKPLRHVGQRAG
ncbi:PA14 domain-containing protein [Hymenobacter humi]|uniref:PA14 domain-containing protein n=1 Tax=Hymenobacter humi TaxID=1411620 RepID=A0ABW2U198_9BACT